MTRWAMIIDLNRCIGCKNCIRACSQANGILEGLWRKFYEMEHPKVPDRQRIFATRSCMHCDEPPCNNVCPSGATFKRADGIVDIDYTKCVGCGYCILACPYDAREIFQYCHFFETDTQLAKQAERETNINREGICTKCNFCLSRIEYGLENNLIPGIDFEATPLCVATCSCGALSFGDLDDPQSHIAQSIKQHQTYRLSEELGTGPSVYYILT